MDSVLRQAIAQRRLVSFALDGRRRIGEPHDYGMIGGESRSGPPIGWRWAVLSKISDLKLLDERFPGPRPAPSGRHMAWDILFASVSSNLRSR